jgi:SAM-dependent methyltransferase
MYIRDRFTAIRGHPGITRSVLAISRVTSGGIAVTLAAKPTTLGPSAQRERSRAPRSSFPAASEMRAHAGAPRAAPRRLAFAAHAPLLPGARLRPTLRGAPSAPATRRGAGAARMAAGMPRNEADAPAWAGGGPVSGLVNALIRSPLYGLMRVGARQVLISTAEKKGVMWREDVRKLDDGFSAAERAAALADVRDERLVYPEYYLKPFHAYVDGERGGGNLGWLAAFEARSATMAMCVRVWKGEDGLSVEEASERLRGAHFAAVVAGAPAGWLESSGEFVAVDVGCSVGISTVDAARRLRAARAEGAGLRVVGIDASPYFLAVAKRALAEVEDAEERGSVEYAHALGEQSGLEGESVNWWGMQFVIHELPSTATRDFFVEAFRVLRPGGVLSLIDNDPASPVIQRLPPAIATLMKSTGMCDDSFRWSAFVTAPFCNFVETLSNVGCCFMWTLLSPSLPRLRTMG